MGFAAAHRGRHRTDAFMGGGDLHSRGLTDDHRCGARQFRPDGVNQPPDAQTADFLIIGKRVMQWPSQVHFGEAGCHCQGAGDEALHVRATPTIELAVCFCEREGVGRPILTVNRYDVGMT